MLKLLLDKFFELPKSVQRAFVLVLIAWTAQFFIAYRYILKEEVPLQFSVMGIMLFMALIFAKKWGLIICKFFTALAVFSYLLFFVSFVFTKRFDIMGLLGVNIALFSASLYYLWKKETTQYFTKRAEDAKAKMKAKTQEYNEMVTARKTLNQSKKKSGPKKKQKK